MAQTNESVVFSINASNAANHTVPNTNPESKLDNDLKQKFDALTKEIESAKNYSDKYKDLSLDAFKKESVDINQNLFNQGQGSAIIFKRAFSKPGLAHYEFRRCAKIYAPDEDYGTIGIERFIIAVSLHENTLVKILELDSFTETTTPSNNQIYISDGEVRLAYPTSGAAQNQSYRKIA